MDKETVRQIIGTAILFDEKGRFDSWSGDEAREWVDMVTDTIMKHIQPAPQGVQPTCDNCGSKEFAAHDSIGNSFCIQCGASR
jgi:hypothetical protein